MANEARCEICNKLFSETGERSHDGKVHRDCDEALKARSDADSSFENPQNRMVANALGFKSTKVS